MEMETKIIKSEEKLRQLKEIVNKVRLLAYLSSIGGRGDTGLVQVLKNLESPGKT